MLSTTSTSLAQAVLVNAETATSFSSDRRFYDDVNFPHGFKRSGDFTNKEAELLEAHGVAMQALAKGSRTAINEEEQHFVDAANGRVAAATMIEKLWQKYVKLAMGKPFYAVVGTTLLKSRAVAESVELAEDDIALAEAVDEPDEIVEEE
ncbi:DUF413 domain-containing protein [Shewanella avicenniae]|uniref:Macrodomain Ori protein n=1 Tax=Shewanella avicenniae TaxID=2814294 RepID=A0ABX7QVT2_9GAMM|nr:DUF413 domain-containing protein [Shewanella avicenniae]QSX35051.1 DUF413 domain-containing protein [Shewanella avicenniae]